MYCTDAIRAPPNIEEITTLLLYFEVGTARLFSLAPCKHGGHQLEYCTDASIYPLHQNWTERSPLFFILLLYFIIDATFLTSTF